MSAQPTVETLLTYQEVAEHLGVSERMVRKLTSERKLTSVKIGHLVRIPVSAITQYVERQTREAQSSVCDCPVTALTIVDGCEHDQRRQGA